jgi:hypothetical protein
MTKAEKALQAIKREFVGGEYDTLTKRESNILWILIHVGGFNLTAVDNEIKEVKSA